MTLSRADITPPKKRQGFCTVYSCHSEQRQSFGSSPRTGQRASSSCFSAHSSLRPSEKGGVFAESFAWGLRRCRSSSPGCGREEAALSWHSLPLTRTFILIRTCAASGRMSGAGRNFLRTVTRRSLSPAFAFGSAMWRQGITARPEPPLRQSPRSKG